MGQCFLYGNGSAGTGLTVVTGLSSPVNPKENTVWVKSDKAGKKYVFAEAAPEAPFEGLIWFLASSAGAITKTSVYTGGAWVATDAYMYLAGSWVRITAAWDGELFDNGNQYEHVTGGWTSVKGNCLVGAPSGGFNRCRMVNKLDVTNYNTIKFTIVSNTFRSSVWGISNSEAGSEGDFVAKTNVGNGSDNKNLPGTYLIDVSKVSGQYYLRFMAWNGNFNVSKVWMK